MRAHDGLSARVYACALASLLAPGLAGCTFDSHGLDSHDLRSDDAATFEGLLDGPSPPDGSGSEQAARDGLRADRLGSTDLTPWAPDAACTAEVCDGKDNDCDGKIDDGFSADCKDITCKGSGKIQTIDDSCVDDYGRTSPGDSLEVFCCDGVARFCLSHEACPWRAGCSNSPDATCSRAGLKPKDEHLASVYDGCVSQAFNGHLEYYCNPLGQIHF